MKWWFVSEIRDGQEMVVYDPNAVMGVWDEFQDFLDTPDGRFAQFLARRERYHRGTD